MGIQNLRTYGSVGAYPTLVPSISRGTIVGRSTAVLRMRLRSVASGEREAPTLEGGPNVWVRSSDVDGADALRMTKKYQVQATRVK
jgi:hypothetical protein